MRNVFLTLINLTLGLNSVAPVVGRALARHVGLKPDLRLRRIRIVSILAIFCLGTGAAAYADGARHIIIVLGENVAIQREVATRFETLVAGNVRGDVPDNGGCKSAQFRAASRKRGGSRLGAFCHNSAGAHTAGSLRPSQWSASTRALRRRGIAGGTGLS